MATGTEILTSSMIYSLRREAAAAGDTDLVHYCNQALDAGLDAVKASDQLAAFDACADAINSARAMDDSGPFVRVVGVVV